MPRLLLRECLELREKTKVDEWLRFHTMSQLGAALAGQGKFAEAEPLLTNGYEGLVANEAKACLAARKTSPPPRRGSPRFTMHGVNPKGRSRWRRKLASPMDADESDR